MQTTRRGFLKGTAAGGVAAASLAGAGVALADEAVSETKYDVDILIVGGGIAGLCAALQAIDLGADPSQIMIIDKMSGEGTDYGGSSLVMSGNYLMASDTSAEGKEAFAEAMYDISGRVQNMDMLTTLADNANDGFEWLLSMGCGYENESNTSYAAAITQTMTNDARTVPVLVDVYAQKGGEINYGIKACKLNLNENGICGVLACNDEGYFNIDAKKVILTTGGFLSNSGMVEEYIGDSAGLVISRAPWSITGDGLTMVKEVGGAVAPLSHGIKALYLGASSATSGNSSAGQTRPMNYGIAVNVNGKRFWNESSSSQENYRLLLDQPTITFGILCDSKQLDNGLQDTIDSVEIMNVYPTICDTLEEVADLFGCPLDELQLTIDEFNAAIVDDHTEGLEYNKTSNAFSIDTPPYYAFYPFRPSSSFLGAGIKTDTSAHVIAADGSVIPNLLAAGEIQGGFAHDEYFHGANTAKATVFGRIAGETAYNEL